MKIDLFISVLVQSNWAFLAGWILLLGAAFALSFPEKFLWVREAKQNSTGNLPHS
jgi:hypothetical protein